MTRKRRPTYRQALRIARNALDVLQHAEAITGGSVARDALAATADPLPVDIQQLRKLWEEYTGFHFDAFLDWLSKRN